MIPTSKRPEDTISGKQYLGLPSSTSFFWSYSAVLPHNTARRLQLCLEAPWQLNIMLTSLSFSKTISNLQRKSYTLNLIPLSNPARRKKPTIQVRTYKNAQKNKNTKPSNTCINQMKLARKLQHINLIYNHSTPPPIKKITHNHFKIKSLVPMTT